MAGLLCRELSLPSLGLPRLKFWSWTGHEPQLDRRQADAMHEPFTWGCFMTDLTRLTGIVSSGPKRHPRADYSNERGTGYLRAGPWEYQTGVCLERDQASGSKSLETFNALAIMLWERVIG